MAACTVVVDQAGGFVLKSQSPDSVLKTAGSFRSEAEVSEWPKRRLADEALREPGHE